MLSTGVIRWPTDGLILCPGKNLLPSHAQHRKKIGPKIFGQKPETLLADGFLSGLPAANTCPAYLGMVGKLLTAPAFCLPVSAEEVSAAPVQKQGVVVQNVLHRDAVKDGELVRQLPAGSKALMVTPCWLKIVPEWLNKGAALTKVMRECGIRPEEAAAFGNGENDLGMLKSVTHGYAMGSKNSPGEIPVRKTPQRPARSAF